jgi:DNA-binding transcriptional LysR family regulator
VLVDKLAAMRAFVEICDRGSLTAAGEALGKSQPTMVRTLAQLEAELGVRLLRRTTRRLSLTDEGRGYLAQVRRILSDVQMAERALLGGATTPRGRLRITAPVTFGQRHVTPVAVAFLQRHDAVQLDLLLLDRVVNLLEEGVDLAVRIGALADSSMVAARVGTMRRVLVASPELLARRDPITAPENLAGAPAVLFRGMGPGETWQFRERDQVRSVGVHGVLSTNQATAAVDACSAGLGFGIFQAYQVAEPLQRGDLELLLEDFEPEPAPVSLVYSDARLMSPTLRVLIDHMSEGLNRGLRELEETTFTSR